MRELVHDNLTRFIGACVQPGRNAILNEYCAKGSLQVGTFSLSPVGKKHLASLNSGYGKIIPC
jgi:hypothetical protein